MTIDDVSARRAISAISSQPVNAPPAGRSRNGSRASTVSCPRARGFCTAKNSLVSRSPVQRDQTVLCAWILHCKEQFGLVAPGTAPKENPCPQVYLPATVLQSHNNHILTVIGRLRSGVSVAQARAEIDGTVRRKKHEHAEE